MYQKFGSSHITKIGLLLLVIAIVASLFVSTNTTQNPKIAQDVITAKAQISLLANQSVLSTGNPKPASTQELQGIHQSDQISRLTAKCQQALTFARKKQHNQHYYAARKKLHSAFLCATKNEDTILQQAIRATLWQVELSIHAAEKDQRQNQLLSLGNTAIVNNRLYKQKHFKDNAWFYYQQILKDDPNNQYAIQGLQRVKNALMKRIKHHLKHKKLDMAESDLKFLRIQNPSDDSIRYLDKVLDVIKNPNSRENKRVEKLYKKGNGYLKPILGKLQKAQAVYVQIQSLSPYHPDLQKFGRKIASEYGKIATQYAKKQKWQKALDTIDSGLLYYPRHVQLIKYRETLQRKIEQTAHHTTM